MKIKEIAKTLANKINQEHYIMHYLEKIQRGAYNKGFKDAQNEKLILPDVVGSFVLYRTGAIDNVYWNGKEFTPYKHNIPSYSWEKADEYAKLLNCNFCDK